jgi:predicted GNAT superfamily acetyltransferase
VLETRPPADAAAPADPAAGLHTDALAAGYTIREARDADTIAALLPVFRASFSYDDLGTPPAWLLQDAIKAGGILLGLWHGEQAVGFSYGLVGLDDESVYLYSDGLGVLPGHRLRQQARALKLAQRDVALARGIERIVWTYSALRSVNAHLYLTALGGFARGYVVDYRGGQSSEFPTEGGVPIDEFVVEWRLRTPRVQRRLAGERPDLGPAAIRSLTRCSGRGLEVQLDAVLDPGTAEDRVRCEVPADFQGMVDRYPERMLEWRLRTRQLFRSLLDAGYALTECAYEPGDDLASYIFERGAEADLLP